MLQVENISKKFVTGDLTQTALDGVSLNLRDNEFVAILGPSGSGKTTLLNIIGGLDRYDKGDLIINGISTKKYKSRDWDSYRNHTIGFVFQSYNLIPHQSILSNVELALTISGVKRKERRLRAKKALEQVGLGNQLHKKPNQMSGGQMQRVAIARALVNNPDVLLADEPTGALDTETGIQIMELLKEVAKDRLVVMVTHNPELANEYATRIVKLNDGKITDDSNPYIIEKQEKEKPKHKNLGKASMSWFTSLSLSFNNLRTKKARTLLTSFAGSIGIIGIALILSISNGVSTYIEDIQKSTMTAYPISIEARTMDLSSFISTADGNNPHEQDKIDHKTDAVYSNTVDLELASAVTTSITENNLTDFKKYLDDKDSEIHQYVGENGITYSYNTKFSVYTYDPEKELVNTDGSTLEDTNGTRAMSMMTEMSNMGTSMTGSNNNFEELMPGVNGDVVNTALTDNYDLVYGEMPDEYNEIVLVLDRNNEITATTLYQLGFLPSSEYKKIIKKIEKGKDVELEADKWSYEEICKKKFYLIPACDTYVKQDNGNFESIADDKAEIKKLMKKSLKLKITGILRTKEDAEGAMMTKNVGYTKALTDYIIDYTEDSEIVKAQKKNKNVNVLSGIKFEPANKKAKIEDTKTYLEGLGVSEKAKLCKDMLTSVYAQNPQMSAQLEQANETQLAQMLDNYLLDPEDDVLLSIYNSYISAGSYDDNMEDFGVISYDAPSTINIYTDSFEAKEGISQCIENYNKKQTEENKITYTDYVGLLMSSVTTIINVISYVLIAFVAVSLVVSSIMIGIITYISVLERTKEIGILRAMGASKRNISQVFNAETFIIGFCSGLIGVGVTLLSLIPANAIIHSLTGTTSVNAALPFNAAVVLIILSMILTLIGGLIPSRKAAKKDPVTALRTE